MTSGFMKNAQLSLIIRGMQVKTTVGNHFTPVRMAVIKKTKNNKLGRKGKPSYAVGKNVK